MTQSREKSSYLKEIIIGVVIAVIAGVVLLLIPPDWPQIIWGFATSAGTLIVKIVKFPIPFWIVLLGIFILLLIRKFTIAYQKTIPNPIAESSDDYREWKLKWRIADNKILNLRPVCSECECELVHKDETYWDIPMLPERLECPNCEKTFPPFSVQDFESAYKAIVHNHFSKAKQL